MSDIAREARHLLKTRVAKPSCQYGSRKSSVSVLADHTIPDPASRPFDSEDFEKVPTMAIETVFVVNNTSIIPDEVLSHRIGLIPIHADPRKFDMPSGEPTDVNTIVFEMRQKCSPIKGVPSDAPPETKYSNSSVYSKSIKWMPQGSQEEVFADSPLRPVLDDILVVKLRPGQEVDLELHCVKGFACASYRLLPRITIKSPITGDDARKFAACFPEGVIEIANTNGASTAVVKDSRRDTVSRECLRHPEFADKIILSRVHDHFICTKFDNINICSPFSIMTVYVIEHLDVELFPWSRCGIFSQLAHFTEYRSMSDYVAPSPCIFTNATFDRPTDWENFQNVQLKKESVANLGIPFQSICLLDSESSDTLQPEDRSTFTHFLFGGILGNSKLVSRKLGFPTRNLGTVQMTTDTAVKTTKRIVEDGIPFSSLEFIDRPEISASANEKLILNFRFLADAHGAPMIAPGIKDLLLAEDDFDYALLE
ncbi:hypothetical protein PSACC_02984 [Paramicrosporidium saccamoebae]|uniref:DNA-directed RNA polymerases I and III subunit RPAC1 n=1 Tax=Paramicrosporidium saccamoebae TaxID=1246581 RepID=A0A2H9THU1_9FUNG|nr:hypothetical protein PSACC_02984 [Paramicrosporidium saccamoebae]